MLRKTPIKYLVLFAITGPAVAMEDYVLDALEIADNAVFETPKDKAFSMFTEIAATIAEKGKNIQRISIDMNLDTPLTEKGRLVLSNRFDSRFYGALSQNDNINSLREAYFTYKKTSSTVIDVGRINTRYGLALGNNPTDFLGENTVRSMTSADPEIIRSNRLGNAMFRIQKYWNKASISAIYSPKLGNQPNNASASLDWGASNPIDRFLLAGSYKFSENFNPQLIYYQEKQNSPKFGLNISTVLNRFTLVYAELSGGRQPLIWQKENPSLQQNKKWRNLAALGSTFSTDSGLTFRIEGHYNGAADNDKALSLLSKAYFSGYGNGINSYNSNGMMSSRSSLLFQVYNKDIIDKYDLNLIVQRDLQQNKHIGFAEIRHNMDNSEIALQWQKAYFLDLKNNVDIRSEQRWQLLFTYHF